MKTTPTRTRLGCVIAAMMAVWYWLTAPRDIQDDGDPWHTHW